MPAAQPELIVEGRHRDPFSFLGPHKGQIRAWLPQAKDAAVLAGTELVPEVIQMKRAPAGLFIAKTDATDYRLRITLHSGEVQVIDDPYRFPPLLTSFELHLHGEGTNYESYGTLGAHAAVCEGVDGVRFAVWAPNAEVVSVTGDHNGWDRTRHPMRLRNGGIWEIFLPGLSIGAHYKYSVLAPSGHEQDHSDPCGFFAEVPPKTASIVWPLTNYRWSDAAWMEHRAQRN